MLRASPRSLLGLVVLAFLAVPGGATNICVKEDRCWTSETVLTEWTGHPTLICIYHPVVRIDSWAQCNRASAGPAAVLRCGNSSEPFTYAGGRNTTHTLETRSNWENVLWGDCSDLVYTVD